MTYPTQLVRRGSGTPLVVVHGNAIDHRAMLPLDSALTGSSGWERIYLDLPGMGATPALGEPGGLPELADWLDDLVESLVGNGSFAMVGFSLGAVLVREVVRRRANQALGMALIAPVVDPIRDHRRVPPRHVVTAELGVENAEHRGWTDFAEMSVQQTEAQWELFTTTVLPGLQAADPDALARLENRYFLDPLPDEELTGWARPVLIAVGRHDQVVGYRDQLDLAEKLGSATYLLCEDAGHHLHLEQLPRIKDAVAEWVSRMEHAAET